MIIRKSSQIEKLPLAATEKWPHGIWDIEAFGKGAMKLIFYAPKIEDFQSPHTQDELYIVITGSGSIDIDGEYHTKMSVDSQRKQLQNTT
ncbi:MAG TPA: hypothetical protein VN030_06425 [Cellvibrio sp.]|nr:hypothetical protein [Cellvibrio sp.]